MTPPPRTPTIGPDAPATLGRRPYDLIVGEPVFSPDSQHFAYAATSGDERWLPILEKWYEEWKLIKRGWQTFVRSDVERGRKWIREAIEKREREDLTKGCGNEIKLLALPPPRPAS